MSIIFGVLKGCDGLVSEEEVRSLAMATERYGQGRVGWHVHANCGMGLHIIVTHTRSALDTCPRSDGRGNAIVFDGRLDNYQEVAKTLGARCPGLSDSEIVLSAFEHWGEKCFSRLVGDWAIALWSSTERTLYLARDHAGTRTLYLHQDEKQFVWSTYLDTFLASSSPARLSGDYVAAYLTGTQIRELTPYEGVSSVLPGHYVTICNGRVDQHPHWKSLITSSIRHKTDAEYEQHFLELFEQAVERRTSPGEPVLGQLSGGMDSTSIICCSDQLRGAADPGVDIVDTVSFYDPSDPDFNDDKYFSIVERERGKVGTHIDIGFSQRTFEPHDPRCGLYMLPGADSATLKQEAKFVEMVWWKGYRSILSGIGGDEVLGGVPIGSPELAGHLLSANIRKFLRQAFAWSLVDRDPLIATLYETVRYTVGLYTAPAGSSAEPRWVASSLRERSREVEKRRSVRHLGVAPFRIDNHLAWWSVLETMPHLFRGILYRPEYRYPFLDKDLVNYLFSIPREQLLRPGERRSLMRRALRDIVPGMILSRRRKAFQLSGPLRGLEKAQLVLEKLFSDSLLMQAGFIDVGKFGLALRGSIEGDPKWWQMLLRTIALELWMRSWDGAASPLFPSKRAKPFHVRLTA
jgi:asparagine synthase (glutamine-hydrolysing)